MLDINDYWFPFFPGRFYRATRHLTTFQKGIYMMLISEYMTTQEPLPNSDIALANIANISVDEWVDNKEAIASFFEIDGDVLLHAFCEEQIKSQRKNSTKRTKAAKKAAASRWENKRNRKMPNACDSDAIAMRKNATGQDNTRKDIITPQPPFDGGPLFSESGKVNEDSDGSHQWLNFDIEKYMNDDARQKARIKAPGWDLHFLMERFNTDVRENRKQAPERPIGAFLFFCERYTNGEPPK